MKPKEIKKLIELVEASSINELEVSRFGKKVRIKKNAGNVALIDAPETVAIAPPRAAPSIIQPSVETISTPAPEEIEEKSSPADSNIIEVRSPMVGTFYQSAAPDADPYVQVGDIITPNQVLCIIEAMKLMNEIEAEERGRIVEILAENGKPVEYNQVLFKIEKL